MSSERPSSVLERLVESFMERQRRGERPSIEEYLQNYPDLAGEIREVFPALALMEELASSPTGSAPPLPEAVAVPTRLGEYRILREVGRGGMGVVYEAIQESLNRHVALKVLPGAALADTVHLQRFKREAQSAARLHHTGIVPVFSVGEDSGVCYYAMQYIAGQSLANVLREIAELRTPEQQTVAQGHDSVALSLVNQDFTLAPSQPPASGSSSSATIMQGAQASRATYFRNIARIGAQVAEALAYAHSQGIVHRDIKPANLMLDLEGGVWVTDFGLAMLEGSEELTHTGDILGTLRYAAPEQLCGKADARSDVYSLGITLYELATLQPAFQEPVKARLVDRILKEEPTAPGKLEPQLPRDLETIILKATTKEPGRRYQSAQELAEDLRRFLADRPVKARRATWVERGWRLCRRNPIPAVLVAGLVLVLLAGLVVSSGFAWLASERAEREAKAHGRADGERKRAESALLRSRTSEYARTTHLAYRALTDHDPAQVLQLLADCPEDLRGWEYYFLLRRCNERLLVHRGGHGRGTTCAIWTFDGRGFVSGGGDGKVLLRDSVSGKWLLSLEGHPDPIRGLASSPDGKRLVSQSDRRLCLWEVGTGRLLHGRDAQPSEMFSSVAFHPDGRRLGVIVIQPQKARSRLEEWEPATERVTVLLEGEPRRPFGRMAYRPDGRGLAVTVGRPGLLASVTRLGIRFYDIDKSPALKLRAEVKWPAGHGDDQLGYTPDGRWLRVGSTVLDADSGRVERSLPLAGFLGGPDKRRKVHFSPDGKYLAAGEFEGIWRQPLLVWDAETGAIVRALGEESVGSDPFFSPDGERLLTRAGDDIRIWQLNALRKPPAASVPLPVPNGLSAGFLCPDGLRALSLVGQTFAGGQWHDEVALWELETGQVVHRFSARSPSKAPKSKPPLLVERLLYSLPHRLSQDGQLLARRAGSELAVFQTATGREVATVKLDSRPGVGLSLSPEGATLVVPAAGLKGGSSVVDARTGKVRWTLPATGDLCFSPDGKRLAARRLDVGPERLNHWRAWETATGRIVLDQEEPVWCVLELAFSPDGRHVAVGGTDYPARVPIRIREVTTGQEVLTLPGQPAEVRSLAYSPDGRRLVASYADGRLKVWDTGTGLELLTIDGCSEKVRFSQDGRRLWTGPPYFILGRFAEGDTPIALHEKMTGIHTWHFRRQEPGPGVRFWDADPSP